MKLKTIFLLFVLLAVFLSGCSNGKRHVTTIDLAAETDTEALFTSEALPSATETTPSSSVTEPVPLEETATAFPATTVYVSTPESTSCIPATESTVYVSTPESTVYITAEATTAAVYIEPSAVVEITQETTILSRSIVPETEAVAAAVPQPAANNDPLAQDYVLNKNSKKFHYPTCSSVSQMKDSNKESVHTTRDEIIAQGYSPCGRCKP